MSVDFSQLKNIYYAMRHGQSEANVAGKIVSDPAIGIGGYGLSALGREQAVASARHFLAKTSQASRCRILSSDFLRARQTATILTDSLHCTEPLSFIPELRERYFGIFDGQSDDCYQLVWAADVSEQGVLAQGVESVASVRERVQGLVAGLESQYQGQQFFLVAHGDVLQIAQTLFNRVAGEQHRQLPHLDVAEIRQLNSN